MTEKEIVYISSIFEKDENGHFTDEALFCQDILRFYFEINKTIENDKPFKLSLIGNWIVRNNRQIVEHYKHLSTRNTRYSYRVHLQEPRLKHKIEAFIKRDLIHKAGTTQAEKVNTDVDLFSYTKRGKLLALIIKSMNLQSIVSSGKNRYEIQNRQNELNQNNNLIYQLLDSTLPTGEEYPYSNIFYKTFYRKVKDEGVFDKLVMHLVEICCSNVILENVEDILESIYDFAFKDKDDREKFLELQYEVFEEQNPELRNIFLYKMKLYIERKFEYKIRHPSQKYEREQFRLRNDYQNVVLECFCNNCTESTILVYSYFDYKKKLTDLNSDNNPRFDCQKCKTKDSCIIPNF